MLQGLALNQLTKYSWQKVLHFNVIKPVTKDHLACETTFLWPKGWSFKTGSTVIISGIYLYKIPKSIF